MGIMYPVRADASEDVDRGYEDFAVELSDQWIVQVQLVDEDGEETDPVLFGPYPPRQAWELGNGLDERVPDGLSIVIDALYRASSVEEILAEALPTDAPTISS